MLPAHVLRCDCCGLPTHPQAGSLCSRCGYPVSISVEERFLDTSLRDLQRVVAYGGAGLTITQLIRRYQARLEQLSSFKMMPATPVQQSEPLLTAAPAIPSPPENVASSQPVASQTTSSENGIWAEPFSIGDQLLPTPFFVPSTRAATPEKVAPTPTALPVRPVNPPVAAISVPQKEQPPAQIFSIRSFFADQTINIVASLGAFLILVGSLGFIATTNDLLISFFTLFTVHAVFGITGVASYRFRSFRLVSVIYTAIFALLVPLVGFSGYQLVAGNLIHLSSPTLIAIAATYAAIVYAALAV